MSYQLKNIQFEFELKIFDEIYIKDKIKKILNKQIKLVEKNIFL